jgi:parallel beta-helix repeat protein
MITSLRPQRLLAAAIVCFLSALLSRPALAHTLYVATKGSDSNTGSSIRAPLATISHALQIARPGDVINLREGIYRQEIDLSGWRGGTALAPITLRSYRSENVVITGSDPVKGWVQDHGRVWRKHGWTVNSQEVFEDGRPLQQIGQNTPFQTNTGGGSNPVLPTVGKGVSDLVPGSFYFDAGSKRLWIELPHGDDPNRHAIEANVRRYVINGAMAPGVTLRGLTLQNCNGTAYGDYGGVVQTNGSGWTIEDCTISGGDFCGLRLAGDHHLVRNCRIVDNGDTGINLYGADTTGKASYSQNNPRPPEHIVFDHLYVSGNNFRHFDTGWHAGGIKAIPNCRDVTIRNSEFVNNQAAGIWFDGDFGDITIENNLVAHNQTGIHYEISQPAKGDPYGILVRNNRIAFNEAQGIYISDSSNAIVENNSCYQNGWDIVVHGMPREGSDISLHDNSVRNNIVDGKNSDIIIFVGKDAFANTADGDFFVHDVRFGADPTPGYDVNERSLASIRKDHGWEEHGLVGDPKWINPDALNFRLRSGSPARGKGWSPTTPLAHGPDSPNRNTPPSAPR